MRGLRISLNEQEDCGVAIELIMSCCVILDERFPQYL